MLVGCALAILWFAVVMTSPSTAVHDPSPPFLAALPGYTYRFPDDHGAHERFRTEWWYYTGRLTAADGRPFGFQLTFFRRGVSPDRVTTAPSAWSIDQLYLAHFAVTDIQGGRFLSSDRVSRAALGKAGADRDRLHVWVDRWSATADDPASPAQHLRASTNDVAIDLTVTPQKPPVIHGAGGVSRKGAASEQTSHYYSLTHLLTDGHLRIGAEHFTVTGLSWMDHEFGSAELGRDIVGWDWFGLHLSDHRELMWYALRRADGSVDPASSGTLVLPDGRAQALQAGDLTVDVLDHWTSPRSKARYPQRWRVSAPTLGLDLTVESRFADQEWHTPRTTRVTYWEGAVSVTGQAHGTPITGQGYVELTGYAERFTHRL